jgi:hypothetical protein
LEIGRFFLIFRKAIFRERVAKPAYRVGFYVFKASGKMGDIKQVNEAVENRIESKLN